MWTLLLACVTSGAPKPETGEASDSGADSGGDTVDTGTDTADSDSDSDSDSGSDTADSGEDTADSGEDTADSGAETGEDTSVPVDTGRFGDFTFGDDGTIPSASDDHEIPSVGDLDGDGLDEIVFTTADAAAPFRLMSANPYTGARQDWVFTGAATGAGAWIAGGQVFLGGHEGVSWVFNGRPAGRLTPVDTAPTTLNDDIWGLHAVGDIDGDGATDVAMYLEGLDDGAAIFRGPLPAGALTIADARTVITGVPGYYVDGAGDFDGDGNGDLLLTRIDTVVFGPIPAGSWSIDALDTVVLTTDWAFDVYWPTAIGDLDGDGRDDIAMRDGAGISIMHGIPRTGVLVPDLVLGDVTTRSFPYAIGGAVDPDGDGQPGFLAMLSDGAGGRYAAMWHDTPRNGDPLGHSDTLWFIDSGSSYYPLAAHLGGPGTDLVFYDSSDDEELFVALSGGPNGADVDRDGFADDCDDTNATIHPYAAEVTDGVDQDCDGTVDDRADRISVLAPATLRGGAGNMLGLGLAAWDDDGDGVASLVVAGETTDWGGIWVVPADGTFADVTGARRGSLHLDIASLGDLDGDGVARLGVSAGEESVYILDGPVSGDSLFTDDPALRTYAHEGFPTDAGSTVAAAGDVDGDGLADLLMGGDSNDAGYGEYVHSSVFLFFGGTPGDRLDPDAEYWCADGLAMGTRRGADVGDVDGDGRDDVGFVTRGGTRFFTGVQAGAWTWDEATSIIDVSDSRLFAADLDGDGAGEIVVGLEDANVVWVYSTPLAAGVIEEAAARATITSDEVSDFGTSLAAGTGPSGPLLYIGAPDSDGASFDAGRVWAFAGAATGNLGTDDAVYGWDGGDGPALMGTALVALDVGGVPSLALGAPTTPGASAMDGSVALLSMP